MAEPTVSIALGTYNGADFLEAQLASFSAQRRRPDELVVCDDGSSDRTVGLVETFSRAAPFPVRLFQNTNNRGSTKNFEQAITHCRGDLIFLSDQDDVWHEEKISRICACFQDRPSIGAVFSDAEVVDARLQGYGYRLWQTYGFDPAEQRRFSSGQAVEVLLKRNVVTGATLAFRREFKPLLLPIPEEWVHDGWIALLIAAVSELAAIPWPLVQYRQHAANQIGGLQKSLVQQVECAERIKAEAYLRQAGQYEAIRERLGGFPQAVARPAVMELLGEKIRHCQARARMSPGLSRRLPLVFRELMTLRYQRYSGGWRSLVKDLLRPR